MIKLMAFLFQFFAEKVSKSIFLYQFKNATLIFFIIFFILVYIVINKIQKIPETKDMSENWNHWTIGRTLSEAPAIQATQCEIVISFY